MVTGEEKSGAGIFHWNNVLVKEDAGQIQEHLRDYPSIIVDIDIDYFSQGFNEWKTREIVEYWIQKASIITIATSPLFIPQDKALTILKKLEDVLLQ